MVARIEDYALIGDRTTSALVARDGGIDWLCWPRFDSEACFAALLGNRKHNGFWRISPEAPAQITRRYRPDTLVLETDFEMEQGAVRLIDFMPVDQDASSVVRIVVGLRGNLTMRFEFALRFDYGHVHPWVQACAGGFIAFAGPIKLVLRAPIPLEPSREFSCTRFVVSAGQSLAFALQSGSAEPSDPSAMLDMTETYWRDWIAGCRKVGRWPEPVKRSLITLKALIHRQTHGMAAAPTLGLPEHLGGSLNWDYRYSWLRDASFTLTALLNAGLREEARHWRDWVLRAAAGSPNKLQVVYRIDGRRDLHEWHAHWLPGYEASRPVTIGNAAAGQRQLDVFGEVVDALHLAAKAGLPRQPGEEELAAELVSEIERTWQEPDRGLWEARDMSRQFTYSKVMAWVGLDRFLRSVNPSLSDPAMTTRLRRLKARLHDQICRAAYDPELKSFTEYYGSQDIDASLLLLPLVGFLPIEDPRIQGTIATVQRELMVGGLVLRRRSATTGEKEGAFIACTLWFADCLAMQGKHEQAHEVFQRVLEIRNDVGLLSEEYDPIGRRLLGNFPQALSHLALVNTALQLSGPVLQRAAG